MARWATCFTTCSRALPIALCRSRDISLAPSFKLIDPNVLLLFTFFPLYTYAALQVSSRSLTKIHVVGLSPAPFIALSVRI